MKKNIFIFVALLLTTLIGWTQTQGPSITASKVTVAPGATTATVDIKVADANFIGVGSFNLAFSFDYANLGVPTVTNIKPAIAAWGTLIFTTNAAIYETGVFSVSAMDPGSGGGQVSLSSGDVLFTITFTKAAPGITSCGYVNFNDVPTNKCEFAGAAPLYNPVFTDGTYTNGYVGVNTVYVDPTYTVATSGWGCNRFATIQSAVTFIETAVNDGGLIIIAPATYTENVTVSEDAITFDNSVAGTVAIAGNLSMPTATTTLTLATDLSVSGVLTLTNADNSLVIGANTLTLNGTFAGDGLLTAGATSNLSIGGTAAFGSLNMIGELNTFTLNRTASGTVTLGNVDLPLEIGTLNLTAGELQLNGNFLNVNTAYTSTSAGTFNDDLNAGSLTFYGTTAGDLYFSGAVTPILGELNINSTGTFTVKNAVGITSANINSGILNTEAVVTFGTIQNAAAISLGANASVTGICALSSATATLTVGANTLTFNGDITFVPSSLLVAGAASSLVFNSADPSITFNTLPSNITSLNNLTINYVTNISMGANLDVLGTLTLTSGSLLMSGKTLTINNPMAGTLTNLVGDNTAATLIVKGTASINLPAITLYNLQVNNDIGVALSGQIDIYNELYLLKGVVSNSIANNILITDGKTIKREGGSLLIAPSFLATVTVVYTGTTSITSGYELPATSVTCATDVTLNNTGGLVMGASHILNSLTLTAGKLTLGTYDLTTTTVTGGASDKYIIADGTGVFTIKDVTAAYVFPVGYATAYTPLTISNSIASDFSVNLKKVTTLAGFTAPVPSPNFVKMQWVITRAAAGTAEVIFNWIAGDDFSTVPVAPVLGRYDGTDWLSAGTSTFGVNTVTVTGITAFSPFAAYGDLITPVYVDDVIGDPTYTGENATNSPAGTGPKKTIKQGLTVVANPGTIYVAAGTYAENIIVNKDVTISGAGATTIVNGTANTANGSVFNIAVSGVTLQNMKINNTAASNALYAVRVNPALDNILIQENTITNNFLYGIVFNADAGTANVVLRNKFEGTSIDFALVNEGTTTTIAGLRNYWGSDNGPKINPLAPEIVSVNPCGVDGKLISSYITYDPWMNADLTSDIYQGNRVISGTFSYPNSGGDITMKTGISLTLKRTSDNVVMATTNTDASGNYAFTGQCTNCSYYIVATSANPTSGAVNTTDAAQVNYWGVWAPYTVKLARFYAGDVTDGNLLGAADALAIQQNFVNAVAFTRASWSFYDMATEISVNPVLDPTSLPTYKTINLQRLPDYTFATAYDQDMYAVVTGDFNQSFNPNAAKSSSSTMDMMHSGNMQISSNQEFDLPVRVLDNYIIGASSLILNFPANMVEVQDVVFNGNNGQVKWAVNGNELRISWYSATPLNLNAAENLLTLKLKTTANFTVGNQINFAMAANPLNELADGQYDVIDNVVLDIDVVDAIIVGVNTVDPSSALKMNNYPNPFTGNTTISYSLPFDGQVSIEVYNYVGERVKTLVNEKQSKGNYNLKLDGNSLSSGIYMATLILRNESNEIVRTIKIINNK